MPPARDPLTLSEARSKIHDRIEGLRPLVVEFNLLRAALMAIDIETDGARTRIERAFLAVYQSPGSQAPELAAMAGLSVGSLVPALRALSDLGLAHRISQCWFPGLRDPGSHGCGAGNTRSLLLHDHDDSRTDFSA